MAWRLLRVWRRPMAIEQGRWLQLGPGVMVMEFVLLHAGVFLASLAVAARSGLVTTIATLGLALFYGLFAAVIAYAFKSRMLLVSYLWMIGGRLLAMVIGISRSEAEFLESYSMLALLTYVPLVIASVLLPLPRWGISPEIAQQTRLEGSSGVWAEQPHRAIAAGTIYFTLLGLSTLTLGLGR